MGGGGIIDREYLPDRFWFPIFRQKWTPFFERRKKKSPNHCQTTNVILGKVVVFKMTYTDITIIAVD